DFGLANEHLGACQRLAYEPQTVELEWTLLAAQTGRFAEHESFLRGLVEQDHPEASPILEVLIDGYIQHFNMRSALHCLDLYLEREPNNLQAWLGRGHVCERLFHWTGAVTAYRRAVDLVPEDYEARLRLASALIVVGPANEAAAEFELLLRLRPRDPEALLGLVRCRRQQNRLEEAQQLLNELTSLRPDDGPVLLERGRLALAGGNPKGAEAWLRKAVERSPCDRETRYALYQCLQQQGKD